MSSTPTAYSSSGLVLVGGLCACLAIALSAYLIGMHHLYHHAFNIQRKIIGILWLVPIYSFASYVGLELPWLGLYVNELRDCYESYALYLFLALMLSYLDGDADADEDDWATITFLETGDAPTFPPPFCYFYSNALPGGKNFILFVKRAVLQYCLTKPLLTLFQLLFPNSWVLDILGFVVLNASILYAIAALSAFYVALSHRLAPFLPLPKFAAIKAIIFCTFWQSAILDGLAFANLLPRISSGGSPSTSYYYTPRQCSLIIQNVCVCMEMLVLSIVHLHIYAWQPFRVGGGGPSDTGRYIGLAVWEEDDVPSRGGVGGVGGVGGILESVRVQSMGGGVLRQSLLDGEEDEVVFYPRRDSSTPHALDKGARDSNDTDSNIGGKRGWVRVLPVAQQAGGTSRDPPPDRDRERGSPSNGFLESNFAVSSAINDLNVSALLGRVLLPSAFSAECGRVVNSSRQIADTEEEEGGNSGSSSSSLGQFFSGGGRGGWSSGGTTAGAATGTGARIPARKAGPDLTL